MLWNNFFSRLFRTYYWSQGTRQGSHADEATVMATVSIKGNVIFSVLCPYGIGLSARCDQVHLKIPGEISQLFVMLFCLFKARQKRKKKEKKKNKKKKKKENNLCFAWSRALPANRKKSFSTKDVDSACVLQKLLFQE